MFKTLSIAESKLRKIEKRNKEIADDLPIVISLIDSDGSVWQQFHIPPRRMWKYK